MFRGRGRGRGGYGQQRYIREEKFEIFPEIKEYPAINLKEIDRDYRTLVSWGNDLQKFWMSSSYHLDDASQGAETNGGIKRRPLSDFMKMTEDYVPAELVARNVRRNNKKVRWNPQADLQRLDFFEKLDRMPQGQDDGDDEKKDEENEDEEADIENEDDDDDEVGEYDVNVDFDDDEDDFNQQDDHGGDEGAY